MKELTKFTIVAVGLAWSWAQSTGAASPTSLQEYVQVFFEASAKAKKTSSPAALENGNQFFQNKLAANANDSMARSFGGALISQTCVITSDSKKCMDALSVAMPELDRAVRGAKKSGSPQEQLVTQRNRAEVYSSLPGLFRKQKIAVADATAVSEMAKHAGLSSKDQAQIKLLLARALAGDAQAPKAKALLAEVKASNVNPASIQEDLDKTQKLVDSSPSHK